MKITPANYAQHAKSVDWANTPDALRKTHETLIPNASKNDWAMYHKNAVIKNSIDLYFQKLGQYIGKDSSPSVVVKQAKPTAHKKVSAISAKKAKSVKTVKPVNASAIKEVYDTKEVEHIDNDVAFIKKYVAMHDKTKPAEAILRLIKGLQKAMLERRITKQSPYATEIMAMQTSLNKCYDTMNGIGTMKLEIQPSSLKRYLVIAHSETKLLSVNLLAAYIRLHGAKGMREVAKKLKQRISLAYEKGKVLANDKYKKQLDKALYNLEEFIEARRPVLSLHHAELNGLEGIAGIGSVKKKVHESKVPDFDQLDILEIRMRKNKKSVELSGFDVKTPINVKLPTNNDDVKIISASELVKMKFQTIGLTSKYGKLIGDPEPAFSAMIFGKPKEGKSTVGIDFAKELTKLGRVLYCAYEEGHGGTLQDKVNRNHANVPGLDFSNKLPKSLCTYKFVFIDSVSDAGLDEVAFKALIRSNKPNTSIIGIFHATKEGKFRGGQTFAHDVDVLMRVESGIVYATGRYAAPGEMKF